MSGSPLRVLLLTQLFQPEPNHLRGLEFAKAVRDAGIDLRVLTGFPNYPGGRLYDGYRLRPVLREVLDGVPVTRTIMYPSHDRSGLRRAATYLTLAASSSIAVCAGRFKPDIVHAYVGPMTLAFPAALARAFRGARTLLDIQDLWPESVTASGMARGGAAGAAVSRMCRWAYRRSDRVVVLSEGYKRLLCQRGVPSERIDVVRNWCDESQIPRGSVVPAALDPAGPNEILQVVYAGNIGALQSLDVVLDASRLLGERGVRVQFTMAGTGVDLDRLRARQEREAITGVRFIGPVPRDSMAKLYEDADALLVHLRDDPLSRVTIPQKTQMCLAAGRPVLMGVRGEAASLVEEAGAGFVFAPESAEGLADAAARLAAMPRADRESIGDRGRRYYADKLSFRRGVDTTIRIYRSLAEGNAA